jgi:hypothetical protein
MSVWRHRDRLLARLHQEGDSIVATAATSSNRHPSSLSSSGRAPCGSTMARRKLSLPAIRRTACALPHVEEGTSYGTPAWRHRGRLLARLHQDGDSIVLKVGNETRDHLLQADPRTFFVTDHYLGYPMVLARLDRLSAADLRKLLVRAIETKR